MFPLTIRAFQNPNHRGETKKSGSRWAFKGNWNRGSTSGFDNGDRAVGAFISNIDLSLILGRKVGETVGKLRGTKGTITAVEGTPSSPREAPARSLEDNTRNTTPPNPTEDKRPNDRIQQIKMLAAGKFEIDAPETFTVHRGRNPAGAPEEFKKDEGSITVSIGARNLIAEDTL